MTSSSLLLCLVWNSIKMGWFCCIPLFPWCGGEERKRDLQYYQSRVFRNWIRPQILTSVCLPCGVRAFMAHVLKLFSVNLRDRRLTLFHGSWGFSYNPMTPGTGAFRKMPYHEILHWNHVSWQHWIVVPVSAQKQTWRSSLALLGRRQRGWYLD